MGDKSKIEWTEASWNPIVGCTIVSKGCTNCYAMKQAHRIQAMTHASGKQSHYDGTTKLAKGGPVWTGKVALAPDRKFTEPLRWSKPRAIFVNSMGDLFHEDVPDEWIDRAFAIMALCPHHTFQVLTKRAERMRTYMAKLFGSTTAPRGFVCPPWSALLNRIERHWIEQNPDYMETIRPVLMTALAGRTLPAGPLPNVWLGVSAEDQTRADERIPHLLETPAAVRFLSAEPLLGSIDLTRIDYGRPFHINALAGYFDHTNGRDDQTRLDWIIVGGESGIGARPMHPDWARSIRDQCEAAGVPFFFKQWGAWGPAPAHGEARTFVMLRDGRRELKSLAGDSALKIAGAQLVWLVGKHLAGRLLDGREHNGMPEVRR